MVDQITPPKRFTVGGEGAVMKVHLNLGQERDRERQAVMVGTLYTYICIYIMSLAFND